MSYKPPITDEGIVKSLENASGTLGQLASCALSVPPSAGNAVRKEFIWSAQEIVEAIRGMASGFAASTDTSKDYLRLVGAVHATLDKVKGSLSVDNAAAVEKRWIANSELLADALGECEGMIENTGNADEDEAEEDGWDEMFGDGEKAPKLTAEELERARKASSCIGRLFVYILLTVH